MEKIEVLTITNIDKLRSGEFADLIPELYELKEIIENDGCYHNNDSIFNHTLRVLEKLEESLKDVKEKISDYLNQKITNYTRKELLFLATLLHDIGKKETLIEGKSGLTSCPNHAEQSLVKAEEILSRFGLSKKEKDLVRQIIEYHMLLYLVVKPDNSKINDQFLEVKREHPNVFLELVLLAMTDILGTQLKENKPEEFDFVISFYKKFLNEY